jgi:AraC family transcriptional regulator
MLYLRRGKQMEGWNEGIRNAVDYIESHLDGEIKIEDAAEKACVSTFYFQKIFLVLCGFSVGEYIRNRRLTEAAQELCTTDHKIIDIAVKYGYNSPDSFTRAFVKFHGITPSQARNENAIRNSVAPLKIKLTLEGGTKMEYKIVTKEQFTVMGVSRSFNTETSYQKIPEFWTEHMQSPNGKIICGMYGICTDGDGKDFDYMIADNYLPWNEVPEGMKTKVIPAGTWAVFPCHGALPKSLQDVNTKIWSEWLPSTKNYSLAGNYNIEMYGPMTEDPKEYYCEIWIPVKKA